MQSDKVWRQIEEAKQRVSQWSDQKRQSVQLEGGEVFEAPPLNRNMTSISDVAFSELEN